MSAAQFIFWHQSPNPHHASYMAALADALPDGAVVCAFDRPLSSHRQAMGWQTPDLGKCLIIWLGETDQDEVLSRVGPDTAHIFNTVLISPEISRWFAYFRKRHARVFLTSEMRDWRGLKGALRQMDSLRHERRWRADLTGVFAMGQLGEKWFEMCGYPRDKIFPFCYVVEDHSGTEQSVQLPRNAANLIFVGSLNATKRLDLAFHGLGKLKSDKWNLQVVGDGPERQNLENLSGELGITDQVQFLGYLENQLGRARIAVADLLILPSHKDGWGAVVNEALMAGTPVICSDACGAADLIQSPALGSVFHCGNVRQLSSCLDDFVNNIEAHRRSRQAIQKWAECIKGNGIANYLINCVNWASEPFQEKPIAPWRKTNGPELN